MGSEFSNADWGNSGVKYKGALGAKADSAALNPLAAADWIGDIAINS